MPIIYIKKVKQRNENIEEEIGRKCDRRCKQIKNNEWKIEEAK